MKEKIFIPPPALEIKLLQDEPQAFKRILIMEDSPEFVAKMQSFLEPRHFDLFFAKTAVSALREIMETDVDVIICDMIKAKFSGRMFHLAVSRVKPHLCNRFIFITGRGVPAETNAFIKQLNGLILWRPFEMHVLLETIHLALQKQIQRKPRAVKLPTEAPPDAVQPAIRNRSAENLRMIQLLCAAATKSIRVVSSYFAGDDSTVQSLCTACERGLAVEIYVPRSQNGLPYDDKVETAWAKLREAGGKIFALSANPTVGRMIICDDRWACFTQSNFHVPNLNIYHEDFTERYLKMLAKQRASAIEVTPMRRAAAPEQTHVFVPGSVQLPRVVSRLKSFFTNLVPTT